MSTAPVHSLRLAVLRAAHDLVRAVQGQTADPLEVVVRDRRGLEVTIRSAPGELGSADPPQLSAMERRLLRVAGLEPLLAKQLASRAGYRSMSHVYAALSRLCQLELLQKVSDGYKLPG